MRKSFLVAVTAFVLGVFVAASAAFLHPAWFARQSAETASLSPAEVSHVLLYAALKDGTLSGRFFNENAEITVTQITVEAVPKEEANPFNKFAPRFFNVNASARPRSMSGQFRVETGALNPNFHTLRITEAKGIPLGK